GGNCRRRLTTKRRTRNATWIMWRTKRARRLWSTRSQTVSASAVRTRHSFSDASKSEQTRPAELRGDGGKQGADIGNSIGRREQLAGFTCDMRRRPLDQQPGGNVARQQRFISQ